MTTAERPLTELIQELPALLQSQVRRYVAQLLQQRESQRRLPLQQEWAGALRDLRDHITSVELQHRASSWMAEDALKRSADSAAPASVITETSIGVTGARVGGPTPAQRQAQD